MSCGCGRTLSDARNQGAYAVKNASPIRRNEDVDRPGNRVRWPLEAPTTCI